MPDPTQDALLEAAFETVVRHGWKGATTRRIAAAAGVNEVTLFRRFGSKDALLREVLRREAETMRTEFIRYTGDLEHDLVTLVTGYRDLLVRRGRGIPAVFLEVLRQPELHGMLEPPLQAIQEVLGLLERYQSEGRLASSHPVIAAIALMAPVLVRGLLHHHAGGLLPPLDPALHVRSYLDGYSGKGATS